MKKFYKLSRITTHICVCVLLSSVLLSCEDDHDELTLPADVSSLVPEYALNIRTSYSISSLNIQLSGYLHAYFDLNFWGLQIDEVSYYMDGGFISTSKEDPFYFEYESSEFSPVAHTLTADITISGRGINTFTYSIDKVINTSSSSQSAFDVYTDYNYVTKGDTFYFSAYINEDRSAPNTEITTATLSWDYEEVGSSSSAPFTISKNVTDEIGTDHYVSYLIKYKQGDTSGSYGYLLSSFTILGDDDVRYRYFLKSRYTDYKNGEYLRGMGRLYKGKNVEYDYGLEIFLDDELISSTLSFPYDHEYMLKNMSIGTHKVLSKWTMYNKDGTRMASFGSYTDISITE